MKCWSKFKTASDRALRWDFTLDRFEILNFINNWISLLLFTEGCRLFSSCCKLPSSLKKKERERERDRKCQDWKLMTCWSLLIQMWQSIRVKLYDFWCFFCLEVVQPLQQLFSLLFHCLSALEEKFADIVFLVDSGLSVQEFQQIRTLLSRLVNQMRFGASAYRLGLAQYGRDVRVEFLLKAHQTKEDYGKAIRAFRQRRLQPNEARNLGSALEYVHANFFTSEAGSRADQGYQQHLVVVTGKDSDDPVYRASRLIKSSGINVVGMSAGASLSELRIVANPGYIYTSIITTVPTLRAIFEAEKVETTLTGGKTLKKIIYWYLSLERIFKMSSITVYSQSPQHFTVEWSLRYYKWVRSDIHILAELLPEKENLSVFKPGSIASNQSCVSCVRHLLAFFVAECVT